MIIFEVEDKYEVKDRGFAAVGTLKNGQTIKPGEYAWVNRKAVRIRGIERKSETRTSIDVVGFLTDLSDDEIRVGDKWILRFLSGSHPETDSKVSLKALPA